MWSQQLRSSGAEGQAHPGVRHLGLHLRRQPGKKASHPSPAGGTRTALWRSVLALLRKDQGSGHAGRFQESHPTRLPGRRPAQPSSRAGAGSFPRPRQRTPNAQNPSRGWGAHVSTSAQLLWRGCQCTELPASAGTGKPSYCWNSPTLQAHAHMHRCPHGHACVCTGIYTRVCAHRGRCRFPYKPLTLPVG